MPNDWPFEYALASKTRQLVALMDRIAAHALQEELDVTFPQVLILVTLRRQPTLSQRSLAETLHLSEPAVCRQIELLVDKAYIARQESPTDRRQYRLRFTRAGAHQLRAALTILDTTFQEVYEPLASSRQRQTLALMDQLLAATRIHSSLRQSSVRFKRGGE